MTQRAGRGVSAFVLAGGQSTRMGRDKALLMFAGQPLIAQALEPLRRLELHPRICGARPDLAQFAACIPDHFSGCGPLAGIEAALAVSESDLNLFVPVDLPSLPGGFLRWMVRRAEASQAVATIPRAGHRLQPLCAVYSRRLLEGIWQALTDGSYKVMAGIGSAAASLGEPIDMFDVETVAAALAPGTWPSDLSVAEWFRNVNTPADFERLRRTRVPAAGTGSGPPIG